MVDTSVPQVADGREQRDLASKPAMVDIGVPQAASLEESTMTMPVNQLGWTPAFRRPRASMEDSSMTMPIFCGIRDAQHMLLHHPGQRRADDDKAGQYLQHLCSSFRSRA